MSDATVLPFSHPHPPQPAALKCGRTNWFRDRVRDAFCAALHRLGAPGAIRPISYRDQVTGQQLDVRVGRRYTQLTVGGRDYYFDRVTGCLEGTGSGCSH